MTYEASEKINEEGKSVLEILDINSIKSNYPNASREEMQNESEYWCLHAESLFYQGKFEESLVCWKEAVKINPINKKAWVKISAVYALLEQDDLATHFYKISENLPIE